ncbi:nuclear transport factor 2 family protein [Ferruginibacter sp. SUN106]|uniref:nuclear transport factor 2 family protein n=1 Tax=Ferruginibacter sp. SUN106 TaxID=2978348 RepID=UPI003D35EA72
MKQFLLFLTFIMLFVTIKAQSAEDSIKTVISKLFDGMKNSDAVLLKTAFADSAILQTISSNKDGKTIIENDSVESFATIVSKMPKGDADERIVYDIIKIDGPLAIVWAPYKFYYKGVFSHCGIDSFQLVKINGEWKIQYLIDTRRKKGCE